MARWLPTVARSCAEPPREPRAPIDEDEEDEEPREWTDEREDEEPRDWTDERELDEDVQLADQPEDPTLPRASGSSMRPARAKPSPRWVSSRPRAPAGS